MLQLGPDREVVMEYLENEDFKYLRALAAFYVRLTFQPVDVYKTLEPFLADYRKLKRRTRTGFTITHIDEFIDELLTKDRVCSTSLWKLPSRQHFEDLEQLDERVSPLGDEIDEIDADEEVQMNGANEAGQDDNKSEDGEVAENGRSEEGSRDDDG
ncbi:MAG: hypothetical protein M1837_004572 [Sclerophora amabilis]|nr:MAG: hypothetical protein M1837_004572 [Sclerophora amabilis]